ncbi:MAG: hypothetical protein QF511_07920 [Rhodospirillales bacterium]|jgi:hypothetical protein|nr:hypothetical protein [Rhodospirillales bacterium]HIJ42902.1 hypothetical protein [Rhodospirillaceae bacterium]MDP7214589.1 hypothetical protein [Rhodospirillales bacterium]HIJ44847.1 hypothetical protein [Rhodospirillaceae bacterium]HIJ93298.1 hypothetical protein [Rhodospirillaceae bacterium]
MWGTRACELSTYPWPAARDFFDRGWRARVWRFYKALKAYCRGPTPRSKAALEKRFERIFSTQTGFATPDRLLEKLRANKDELLLALERPIIPPLPNIVRQRANPA